MSRKLCLMLCASAASLFASQGAQAQPTAGAAVSEEVIVTARRREESLQDVPVAVTAISGEVLEQKKIDNIQQLTSAVPALMVATTTVARDSIGFAIRGQRTNEVTILSDPPVGTYFAEVVQPRNFGFGYTLYDLQNVQVLKGVQGTSFGRNVTAGAVLIEPQHPKHEFEAKIKAEAGNYGMWSTYGMVNLPLVEDKLAVRVNGIIKQRDGFTIDAVSGRDYDDLDYNSFRASVLFTPTDTVESLTIYDYVLAKDNGSGAVLTEVTQTSPFRAAAFPFFQQQLALGPRRVVGSIYNNDANPPFFAGNRPFHKTLNWGVTNKTKVEVGELTIRNIFGYRRIDYRRMQDFYNIPLHLISSEQSDRISTYSEELRVDGQAFDDRLSWTVGAFGFLEAGRGDFSRSIQFRLTAPGAKNTGQARFADGTAISYAMFGTGEYKLSDHWKIAGGLRWNHDQRSAQISQINNSNGACALTEPGFSAATPLSQCFLTNGNAWRAVTWDVTLQWEPTPDTTIYGSQRSGFRSGGFAMRGRTQVDLTPFNPEFVKETEFGLKQQWDLNGTRLTANGALFYQDLKDLQLQLPTSVGGTIATITVNTGAQKNYGGELELGVSFPWGLDLSGFYALVNVADVKNRPFNSLIGVPKHQLGLSANYTFPFDESVGPVVVGIDTSYRSAIHLDDFDPGATQNGYALMNVHLDWEEVFGTGLGLGLFATNVLDKTYRTGGVFLNDLVGLGTSIYGEPRMYGGSVSYKF